MPTPLSQKEGLRDSNLGALLRVPVDKLPSLDGFNNWAGTNQFTDLQVEQLTVLGELTIYDEQTDISAGVSAGIGTVDAQDFFLKSNNVRRWHLLSGGAYVFASAKPAGTAAVSSLGSDNFNRADESPLASPWLHGKGANSRLHLSSNRAANNGATDTGALAYRTDFGLLTTSKVSATIRSDLFSTRTHAVVLRVSATPSTSGVSGYGCGIQEGSTTHILRLFRFRTVGGAGATDLATSSIGNRQNVAQNVLLEVEGSNLSASLNGSLVLTATDTVSAAALASGHPGMMAFVESGTTLWNAANTQWQIDDWAAFAPGSVPTTALSAGDIVVQASANWSTLLGTDTLGQWMRTYDQLVVIGSGADWVMTGPSRKLEVSAGASAIFPATTYGVVRLLSAVGTAGLSGVVGLSGGLGIAPSAVGNDIFLNPQGVRLLSAVGTAGLSGVVGLSGVGVWASAVGNNIVLSAASATFTTSAGVAVSALSATQWAPTDGLWSFRNLRGSNLAGTSASANFYLTADQFTVWVPASRDRFVGTGLAVSANITVSGANGRDVSASFPMPSWVHLYVISGTGGVAGLWSSAAPVDGPVLPSGYSSWAYAHANRLHGASGLSAVSLLGSLAAYHSRQLALNAGSSTTETAIDLSEFIPPNNLGAFLNGSIVYTDTTPNDQNLLLRYITGVTFVNIAMDVVSAGDKSIGNIFLTMPAPGQQIYYLWAGATGTRQAYLLAQGYVLPNGAF